MSLPIALAVTCLAVTPAPGGPTLATEDTLRTEVAPVLVTAPRVTLDEILDRGLPVTFAEQDSIPAPPPGRILELVEVGEGLEHEYVGAAILEHGRLLDRALERPVHRARLEAETTITIPPVTAETDSSDGFTRKYLLGLADGHRIETVLMRFTGRVTACISSHTTRYGLIGLLSAVSLGIHFASHSALVARISSCSAVLTGRAPPACLRNSSNNCPNASLTSPSTGTFPARTFIGTFTAQLEVGCMPSTAPSRKIVAGRPCDISTCRARSASALVVP